MTPAMMLQPSYSKRPRVRIPIKQEWLAPAKMSYTRPVNILGKMPAGAAAVLHQFFFSMMCPYVLQIRHGSLDFATFRHRMNKVC